MSLFEIFFIALGLASDALAASICKGLSLTKINKKDSVVIAGYFAFFQAIMPIIGYIIGYKYEHLVSHIDHWIVLILLSIIGFKMLQEAKETEVYNLDDKLNFKEMITLSIATSIDAFAVGISIAFLKYQIIKSAIIIGVITFILCYFGSYIGSKLGYKYKNKSEILGGTILIIIGLKIFFEHII